MIVLLLCVGAKGWADGETVIFSEDFSGLNFDNYTKFRNVYPDWSFTDCQGVPNLHSIKLLTNGGTILTPTLNRLVKDAMVYLQYTNGNNSGTVKVTLSVENKGSFSDGAKSVTIQTPESGYTFWNQTFHIIDGDETTQLKFTWKSGGTFNLAGITVTSELSALSVDTNNDAALNAFAGEVTNVTVNRTFPANTWCTLCLPFEVTASSIGTACGTDAPRLRVFSSVEGNTMKFTAPTESAVSAGTPFLLKFTTAVTSNPVFNGVTISKTGDAVTPAETVKHGGCSFIGTYSPVSIDPTDCFLNSDGQLCHPKYKGNDSDYVLPGLRAYFILPTTTSGARPVVSIAGDDATTVGAAASVAPSVEAIYTLGGLPVASPKSPGIYIVRRTDGSTQKVTIR